MTKLISRISLLLSVAAAVLSAPESYGSPYSDAVNALNPNAYYRSDGSGAAGSDSTGNHDFTSVEGGINFNVPGPRPSDGFAGMDAANDAWDFSSGLRAQVQGAEPYIPAVGQEPRTVVGWFNTDVTRQQHGGLIDLFGWASNLRTANTFKGWTLKVDAGFDPSVGTLGFDVVTLNIIGRQVQGTTTPIEPGDWHMVGVTYDGGILGNAEIYVDGVLQDLVQDTGVTPANPLDNLDEPELDPIEYGFFIGRDSGGFAMDGQVDHVSVWESALTGADIQNLWNVAVGAPTINADFNSDGERNGKDFAIWQRGFDPSCTDCTLEDGDSNGDMRVDGEDRANWESQYGQALAANSASEIPEPVSMTLTLMASFALIGRRRARGD